MRKLFPALVILVIAFCQLLTVNSFAQAPQGFSYQGVARDNVGNILAAQSLGLQISLRSVTPTGAIVYRERHTPTTNQFGLFNIKIGSGTVTTGNLSSIDWGASVYFIQVEMDATGGTAYTDMGTSQLLSVPYALYAETSGTPGVTGPTGATGNDGVVGPTGPTGDPATDDQTLALSNDTLYISGGNSVTLSGIDHVNTLDMAYNQGGAGVGRMITADSGAVHIGGEDGLLVTGTYGSGDTISVSGAGERMFFNPNKAAYRVGAVSGTYWDNDSVGNYSVAMGHDTKALGDHSTALGHGTTALGTQSTAMGGGTKATATHSTAMGNVTLANGAASTAMGSFSVAGGNYSTAMGDNTLALGERSVAMGYLNTAMGNMSTAMGSGTFTLGLVATAMGFSTTASGDYSTSMGYSSTASGEVSTAIGTGATASGFNSIAMGGSTTASGLYSTAMGVATLANGSYSTTMGNATVASGYYSTAMGRETLARSYAELAIGAYNTGYTPVSTSNFNSADRLFVIGNGTDISSRSDAMVVLKNGNTGIGSSTPNATLDVAGSLRTVYSGSTVFTITPGDNWYNFTIPAVPADMGGVDNSLVLASMSDGCQSRVTMARMTSTTNMSVRIVNECGGTGPSRLNYVILKL